MTEGSGKNIQDLLQAAQQMQQRIKQAQSELAQKTVEGSAGGGMVVAVANGQQRLVSLRIEQEVVDPEDVTMLEDLVLAAVNQALAKAQEMAQAEMAKVTGQVNLGNLGNLF